MKCNTGKKKEDQTDNRRQPETRCHPWLSKQISHRIKTDKGIRNQISKQCTQRERIDGKWIFGQFSERDDQKVQAVFAAFDPERGTTGDPDHTGADHTGFCEKEKQQKERAWCPADVAVLLRQKKQGGGQKHFIESVKIDAGGEKLQADGQRTDQEAVQIRQIDHLSNLPGSLEKEIDRTFRKEKKTV